MLSVRTSYSTHGHKEQDTEDAQLRSSSEPSPARRHHCPRLGCGKSFSSPGHLRRHLPIHTGQKNHPCPFPGCRMKCSRQDNLQQHYKIHFKTDTPLRKAPPKRKIIRIHDPTPAIIFGSGPSSALELNDPSLPSINSPPPLEEAYFTSDMFALQNCNLSPSSPSMNSPPPLREAHYPLRRVDCWPQMILSTPATQIAPPVLPATFDDTQSPRYSVSDPHFSLPKLEIPSIEDREASIDTLAYAESHCTSSEYTASSCSPPSWIPDSESTSPAISLVHPIPRVSQPRSRLLDHPPCGEEFYDPISTISTYRPPSVPYQYPSSLLSPIRALEYGNEPHSWQPFQAFTSDGFISAPPPRRRHFYPQSFATNMGTCNVSAHRAQNSGYIY